MPGCPEVSNLPQFCVGGQFSPASCDLSETPDIRVVLRLVDEAGNFAEGVTDPNICTEYMPTITEEIHVGSGGCWCICIPFANYSSVDPLNAAHPSNTSWEVRLFSGDAAVGEWSPMGLPRRFRIDADHDYVATCGGCAPYTVSCGSCIPITCLLSPTGTVPSTVDDAWCDAVMGCVTPALDALAAADLDLQAQINDLPPDTFVTFGTDGDGNITATNADGSPGPTWLGDTDTFVTFGVDGDGNITAVNADGSPGPTWLQDTDTFVTFGTDADGNITSTNADGTPGPTMCPAPCIDTDTFVTFGVDGDGNITATNADGTAGPTWLQADLDTDTFVTFGEIVDGVVSTTNADGTAGPDLCAAPCSCDIDALAATYVTGPPC